MPDWNEERLPEIIRALYRLIEELEAMFPGRHFTPDGHTVGSIGEALAAHYYGVKLLPASTKGRDATIGKLSVEIKATQGDSIALRHEPDHLLVLKLHKNGSWSEIYNGPGNIVWQKVSHKQLPKNGQYQVRCNLLQEMMKNVPVQERLKERHRGQIGV